MTTRVNWFEGMEVSVFDMTFSSIAATANEMKFRVSDLFTPGVVNGLSVYGDPDGVHAAVSAGTAYDTIGERINVPSAVLGIGYHNANLNINAASYTIIARYAEINDGTAGIAPDGTSNFNHILDWYQILALKNGTDSVGTNDVRLGVASVSVPGATFIIYNTPRDTALNRLGLVTNTPTVTTTRQKQTLVATSGQTVFNLGISYMVGANSLDVYVNGVEQTITTNYLETGASQITFTYGLNAGDSVDIVVVGTVTNGPPPIHGSTHLQAGSDPIPYSMNYVTASGAVTLTSANYWTIINKTVPDVTVVTLPSAPTAGIETTVKDGKGDASLRPITLVPAAGTIDGGTNFIMNVNRASLTVVYNGVEWSII